MSELEPQNRNHYLLTPAPLSEARRSSVRAANPTAAEMTSSGNQSAQRFAEGCPLHLPAPGSCPFGGICHSCPRRVQAKLQISQPGDPYEQEADRVADQVMRMPEPSSSCSEDKKLQTKLLANQIPPLVQRQEEESEEEEEPIQTKLSADNVVQKQEELEEEEETVQAKQVDGKSPQVPPRFEAQIHTMRGSGLPLPKSTRDFFEPRFGADFSQLKIHTDVQADIAARMANARAFTIEQHIAFGASQFAPQTREGRRLIAHELTHVIQQRSSTAGLLPPQKTVPSMGTAPIGIVQRECMFFPTYSPPDTYCETRAEAEARAAQRACEPDRACFIRNDGPPEFRWRRNAGYGCAHYVAHRLGIKNGLRKERCFAGFTLRIRDLIADRSAFPLSQAQVNDIWTAAGHAGVVQQVGSGARSGQVYITGCDLFGEVGNPYWIGYGEVYR